MITGKYYTEGSAAQSDATLHSNNSFVTVRTGDGRAHSCKLEELVISDRLGNVERKLTLKDGSVFTTHDNNAIDSLLAHRKGVSGVIHSIESHMGWVVTAIVSIIFTVFVFFKWGIPWASTHVAHLLPQQVNELIGENGLKFLDDFILKESELDGQTKEAIRLHFDRTLRPLVNPNDPIIYKLHFRQWKDDDQGIPNALALPSGDIILTDAFIQLTEKNQDEIDAVILHEMGHIVHRHSLQRIIASTFITTVVMMITGDTSSVADLGFGIGSLLVSSHYSRKHESEADIFAFEHMLQAKIDPKTFADVIQRMTAYLQNPEMVDGEVAENRSSLLSYISSHPETADRVQVAHQYSICFQQGLSTCGSQMKW